MNQIDQQPPVFPLLSTPTPPLSPISDTLPQPPSQILPSTNFPSPPTPSQIMTSTLAKLFTRIGEPVTAHGNGFMDWQELTSTLVILEDDSTTTRDLAPAQPVQKRNNSVNNSSFTTDLTPASLQDFQAMVFSNTSRNQSIEFSEYYYSHPFPLAFTKFANVFCECDPDLTVVDLKGEAPHTCIFAAIGIDNPVMRASRSWLAKSSLMANGAKGEGSFCGGGGRRREIRVRRNRLREEGEENRTRENRERE